MMIAALARLTDGRSSCLALQTFEDAKDPAAECKYREKGRRQTQKETKGSIKGSCDDHTRTVSFFLSFRMPRDTWLVAAVSVH
jgi:hypothetical protein